jgi:hypothetical protein
MSIETKESMCCFLEIEEEVHMYYTKIDATIFPDKYPFIFVFIFIFVRSQVHPFISLINGDGNLKIMDQ